VRVKLSLVSVCLLAGSALLADSTSIADALKNGKINGEFALYANYADVDHSDNNGIGVGSFNLGFTTDPFYDVRLDLGSRANHVLWEVDGIEDRSNAKAVLHTANLAYLNQYVDVVLGRQEINLNWASDFHEALVGVVKVIPDTTLVVGYTQRYAIATYDDPLITFSTKTELGDDGALVVDAKWSGFEGLVVNPFIYYAKDVAAWAGFRTDYDHNFGSFSVGGTIQYTQSKEEVDYVDDGSFLQIEARGSFIGINSKLGVFKADKDGGIGSIAAAGNNVNPFVKGCQIKAPDAQTIYLGASYEFQGFEFSGLYGYTEYGFVGEFHELDLVTKYNLNKNLALKGAIVIGESNDVGGIKDDDYGDSGFRLLTLGAVYSF
jgi:hypothetical protein